MYSPDVNFTTANSTVLEKSYLISPLVDMSTITETDLFIFWSWVTYKFVKCSRIYDLPL